MEEMTIEGRRKQARRKGRKVKGRGSIKEEREEGREGKEGKGRGGGRICNGWME